MVMFGMANGLITIARGTVPLALFGASGYGRLVGRIGGPFLVMQSIAPLVLAAVAERASDTAALALVAMFAVVALCVVHGDPPARLKLSAEHQVDVLLRSVAVVAFEPRAVDELDRGALHRGARARSS